MAINASSCGTLNGVDRQAPDFDKLKFGFRLGYEFGEAPMISRDALASVSCASLTWLGGLSGLRGSSADAARRRVTCES